MLDLVFLQRKKRNRKRSNDSHLDHPGCIALLEVVQHGGLMQVCHHGHVLDLVKLRGIHGEYLVTVQSEFLGRTRKNK